MSLADLKSRVERAHNPVTLILGDARPLVVQAVDIVEAAALARAGLPAFNHDSVRCSDSNPERAIVAARTPPMMGEVRVVVVREIDQGSDDFYQSLADYLTAPSPTTALVLTGERLPKQEKGRPAWARKLKDGVKKAKGDIVEFKSERIDSRRFAVDHAKTLGKKLERDAAQLLVDTIGGELDRVQGEVDKLALYVGSDEVIGLAAVQEACALLAEAEIWDLTAALAARDRATTIAALYRLQSAGDEPRRILAMIAWQSRQLLEMAQMANSGANDDTIRRAVRMRWDTFKRVRPLLEESVPAAEDLLRRLAAANRDMNSHRAGAGRILDGLVLEMLV